MGEQAKKFRYCLIVSPQCPDVIKNYLFETFDKQILRLNLIEDLHNLNEDEFPLVVWVISSQDLKNYPADFDRQVQQHASLLLKIIIVGDALAPGENPLPADSILIHLTSTQALETIRQSVKIGFDLLRGDIERINLQSRLTMSYRDIRRLTDVGQALANEKDFDKLIDLILQKARELVSADGGSIYITERKKGEAPTHIRFMRSALVLDAHEFLLPINRNSIAGYVALTAQPLMIDNVHDLPKDSEYSFNAEFDRAHNYYTKSMMVIPMKNHRGDVIGVLQLINKKVQFNRKLTLEELKSDQVISFTQKDYEILAAMAGQAAIAIENNILLGEIQNLFEGFVKASVTAIEQRDPTTSGHSFRVADYAVSLAETVDRARSGPFEAIKFTQEQLRELRYASLLHDFGKVGVREHVLVKAKKLYPAELELITMRFNYIRKAIEADIHKKHLAALKNSDRSQWPRLEAEFAAELAEKYREIDQMFDAILSANEPSVLEEGSFEFLKSIAERTVELPNKQIIPFLRQNELLSLSIRKGTLDEKERREIESHVVHTYNFLVQIPWTRELRNIPDIAHGHHEKLDGSGYPLRLSAENISLQTRMMTIADIYDALTAWDRPYKKAVPPEKALDILKLEARDGHIDSNLLDVFIDAGIFKRIEQIREFGHDVVF